MKTIILSPHFDDAALSVGGWIVELLQQGGAVEVWTVCTGLPPDDDFSELGVEYHANWDLPAGEVIEIRKREDAAAMGVLGVRYRYFDLTDALYRKHPRTGEHLYPDEQSLFGGLHPGDQDLLRLLAVQFAELLPKGEFALVSPLTVGNHADHLLVRAAAEQLVLPIWYYADYPYTRKFPNAAHALSPSGWSPQSMPVSPYALSIWQESIAAYASQISSFWPSLDEMRQELTQFWRNSNGVIIWQPKFILEGQS